MRAHRIVEEQSREREREIAEAEERGRKQVMQDVLALLMRNGLVKEVDAEWQLKQFGVPTNAKLDGRLSSTTLTRIREKAARMHEERPRRRRRRH
jgi:hypothetical protein